MRTSVQYMKDMFPIKLEDNIIEFDDTVEHVGILRNVNGNLPNILNRFKEHKKKLGTLLHTGMSRRHRGNPAASIRVDQVYGIPVLLSGLGALVLLKSEEDILDHHHKETTEKLLRLLPGTPPCVTAFLSGSLPGVALLHIRQLSNFAMICRLQDNVLRHHALHVLTTSKPSSRSWFLHIRNLCLKYGLPHPLQLLESPLSKFSFKALMKKKIINYWEVFFREAASTNYTSLEFFKPEFMSLCHPHPMLTTAGASSYLVTMSRIQSIMISGRYRTQELVSNWSKLARPACHAMACLHLNVTEICHIFWKNVHPSSKQE